MRARRWDRRSRPSRYSSTSSPSASARSSSVTEQEARIARMADRGLVDEERVGNQPAAGPERAHKFREQRAVEKIYVHDGVERFVLEMKAIQVCDDGPDARAARRAQSRRECASLRPEKSTATTLHARASEREALRPRPAATSSARPRGIRASISSEERLGRAGADLPRWRSSHSARCASLIARARA